LHPYVGQVGRGTLWVRRIGNPPVAILTATSRCGARTRECSVHTRVNASSARFAAQTDTLHVPAGAG
jgi:hypothetical protein